MQHPEEDIDLVELPKSYYQSRLEIAEALLLDKARAGEIWAIEKLLKLVAETIEARIPLSENIATFISAALCKIHDGIDANKAFGIKRARGEKNTRQTNQKQFSIAYFIETQEGTLEDKLELAAIKFSVSVHTAKAAWKKNHKKVKFELEMQKK